MRVSRVNPVVETVTKRIQARSEPSRGDYLERITSAAAAGPHRTALSCSNLAHGMAASDNESKRRLSGSRTPNVGIVTAYNDMLSAHQPFEDFPQRIKRAAAKAGATAQVAGGVPAMCDGVTQGQDGMDLSLFSRDVIAMSTAVALSHNMFDAALCLGVCDKIVPGLLIGALAFGHIPVAFVPAGPMVSGLPNKEKARIREEYAAGNVGREELLAAESASYHSPGTCTFYGTANSNQMLMEFMGLQLPGGSFINPGTELRARLTDEVVRVVLNSAATGIDCLPLGHVVDEKAIVNAIVGLLATGGSTNHTLHLVAIAAAAGIVVDWDDFAQLSTAVPLMARVYPNGLADVNHFHAAGGLGYTMRELMEAGLLHEDVHTILGTGLRHFLKEPMLRDGTLLWREARRDSLDTEILSSVKDPFSREGGLRVVDGNLGRGIVKVSAVADEHHAITAPARVFRSQEHLKDAFNNGELERDLVAVLPGQGAAAKGMPELHKLTPYLGLLQNRGFRVALVTDGRMSGASGKVLSAIQLSPEAIAGGPIAKVRDDDMVTLDATAGILEVKSQDDFVQRPTSTNTHRSSSFGVGRELFEVFRNVVSSPETGATVFRRT